jgi:hypothetical protein
MLSPPSLQSKSSKAGVMAAITPPKETNQTTVPLFKFTIYSPRTVTVQDLIQSRRDDLVQADEDPTPTDFPSLCRVSPLRIPSQWKLFLHGKDHQHQPYSPIRPLRAFSIPIPPFWPRAWDANVLKAQGSSSGRFSLEK